jgi:DNA polymerase-1
LLAHFSQEEKLREAFVNGLDIHTATASQIFHVEIEKVTKEQRRIGKTVNFGVVYGISAFGLADQLKISNTEAQAFIDAFYASYPKVRSYFDQLKADARNLGYIETLYGRRRDASGLNTANYQLRSAAEREISNFPLQGSAADIMKVAMIRAQQAVEKDFPDFAKMVLQVHDELIFEVQDAAPEKLLQFTQIIGDLMANVIKINVPMNVSSAVAYNWGELK